MQFEDVIKKLDQTGIEYVVHEHDPNLTMEAVEESGAFDMDVALKTMVFEASDRIVAVLLVGRDRVDYRKTAQACGVSRSALRSLDRERVSEVLGDIPGGIGPVQGEEVLVIADESIPGMGRVSCGAGRPDRTLELDASDLISVTKARVVSVSRSE